MKKSQFFFLSVIIAFFIAFFFLNNTYFSEPIVKEYYIKQGDARAFYYLSKSLEQDNIIPSAVFLRVLAKITGIDKQIQAGYYDFSSDMSAIGILFFLHEGMSKTVSITVVEGYDIYDIARLLKKKKLIDSQEDFIQMAKSPRWLNYIKKSTGITAYESVEGFLYPETYFVKKGAPLEVFFSLAIDTFVEKFKGILMESFKTNSQSFYFELVKASLIEKETSIDQERFLVSSVIENRLKKGMKLRIDPTIIYVLKRKNLDEQNLKNGKINIKRSHFYLPSPFNTYYAKGLPPSPICSPSLKSLKAALLPARTPYLFFVAKTDSKEHVFTTTYEEHKYFVDKYQR